MTRPIFGIALIAAVVAAIFGGPLYIALFAALAGVAAAREWHRMVGERVYGPAFILTSLTIIAALAVQLFWHSAAGWAVLAVGAVIVTLYAAFSGHFAAWHGLGPLYLGIAPLALLFLRGLPEGPWIIIGMFLAVWATDTGALILGNLIGGPRLWPALSPNKTWSGTLGAVAAAAVVEAVYVAILGGHPVPAAVLGAAVAIVSHAGDLFESWVKRVFQRKDSGAMIPGHGGVLDRIDSTLFAVPFLALGVLAGLNPMFGAHP
ncbi:MAG: phosphatidate cytidylyltransferase [Rhizomicrobium sp.]